MGRPSRPAEVGDPREAPLDMLPGRPDARGGAPGDLPACARRAGVLPARGRSACRALDLEGERRVGESIDGVGTRHRSAYRLCKALPGVVAVVVSQDGNVRFVRRADGDLTYWAHT